jgi:omega-6 fatty acid desaturase (delta-12 desaturase)
VRCLGCQALSHRDGETDMNGTCVEMPDADAEHQAGKRWMQELAPYEQPDARRSAWQLVNTIGPFLILWAAAYLTLDISVWLAVPILVVAAGFLVRIFILFHDCTHHSFFKNRKANEWAGIVTGFLTGFPYHQWRREHAIHHATSSNLSRRGTGDIWTLTVDEYTALPWHRRLAYRLYRNPVVMFGFGPLYLILIAYRFNKRGAGFRERWNTRLTNVALLAFFGLLCVLLGWERVVIVEGSILYLSAMVGIWLFYVQHQFEQGYFEQAEEWDYVRAALKGSSFYRLPSVLQWIVGNIGFHHIHHLSPRVPNYNLRRVHNQHAGLRAVTAIGLWGSLRSLRYRLWDEKAKRFRSFRRSRAL